MRNKEEMKKQFEEHYSRVDLSTTTPDDLMNILEEGKVILVVRSFKKNKCDVRSLALIHGDIMLYGPEHILKIENANSDDEAFKADNLEEWRNEFEKEGRYIDIYDDGIAPLGNSKDFLYETVTEKAVQVYVSTDKENFYGPLEIDFIELWLDLNEDYYI